MRLGEVIRTYREKNDLSMGDFAKMSGLSKPYISMLEANKNSRDGKKIVPSVTTLQKVSRTVKIPLDNLLRMLDDEQEICLKNDGLSEQERELINGFGRLNTDGKSLVLNMINQLGGTRAIAGNNINIIGNNVRGNNNIFSNGKGHSFNFTAE